MKTLKLILSFLLSLSLGAVFIYSGYTKLYPIEPFEFTFVDIGVANWYVAPVMARLMIGLEFFIALLLIIHYNLRKFTLPLMFFILVFFIVYLVVLMAKNGNSGNCGCFGETIYMTPLQGILKNMIMIIVGALVFILSEGWRTVYHKLVLCSFLVPTLALPFIVNSIDYNYTSNNMEEKVNYPLGLELLYAPADTSKVEIPRVNLREGKHVLAFLSLTCSHCRIAAKKFRLIKKNNPDLPIYFVLNGNKADYPLFIQDTKADNIPSSFCLGKSFVQLASAQLPRIYYLDNGSVVKKVDYFELNQYRIENWIETGKP